MLEANIFLKILMYIFLSVMLFFLFSQFLQHFIGNHQKMAELQLNMWYKYQE